MTTRWYDEDPTITLLRQDALGGRIYHVPFESAITDEEGDEERRVRVNDVREAHLVVFPTGEELWTRTLAYALLLLGRKKSEDILTLFDP